LLIADLNSLLHGISHLLGFGGGPLPGEGPF
jgi:hypothetical protein